MAKKFSWRYLFKFHVHVGDKRGHDGGKFLLHWRVLPIFLLVVRYRYLSVYDNAFEDSIRLCLFPGFPPPGGEVKISFEKVFRKIPFESQVPRWESNAN